MKIKRDKNYFKAVAVMIGYTIGVGMFGLPFLTAQAGYATFFIFLFVLGIAQYLIHLIYANLIIVTPNYHRLPGYVGKYLGKKGKIAVFIAKLVGNYGALLAYIIISGMFLNQLLSGTFGGNEFIYSTLVFLITAGVVYFGIGMIARFELYMTAALLLVVIFIAFKGCSVIKEANFILLDWKYFLLPYGAMLLALDGNGSLPIVAKILKKDKARVKSVIRLSLLLAGFIIIAFTITIVGISGSNTTPDALSGVKKVLDNGVILFALIFGLVSMVTSILGVSESIKETLMWDFKVKKKLAWVLAVIVPYLLYLAGFKDLIAVISFIGAVGGGFCAIMLLFVFEKLKKKDNKLVMFKFKPGKIIIYFLISLFVAGMVYEIVYFII